MGYKKELSSMEFKKDSMRKKVLVRGPALTRSGYGEQCRFALRSLRTREDKYELFLIPVNWGKTGWIFEDSEERRWLDTLIEKTVGYQQNGGQFDISLQVTIPNEWERMAPVNVGYTAGIETTRIAPVWIEKANIMDSVIVVSNHSKYAFDNTNYKATNNTTGDIIEDFRCKTPVIPVNYPVRLHEKKEIDINFETDFNFLVVAQWGTRKNLDKTTKWFIEEFHDDDVGLVLKTTKVAGSILDRYACERHLKAILNAYPDRKCKVYLLHGDMSDGEMASLYAHPQIKAFITLTHGEGFGLPIFEAAHNNLPVIAPGWSGQCDFLYAPIRNKKTKKVKIKGLFAKVEYELKPVQEEAIWENVLIKDSMWCFPKKASYKAKIREVYKDYRRFKSQAKILGNHINVNFTEERQYKKFIKAFEIEQVRALPAQNVMVL